MSNQQQPPKARGRSSRILSIFLGLGVLAAFVAAAFFFLQDNSLKKKTGGSQQAISSSELADHSADGDCWLLMHGNVYDLTGYASEHPGGPSFILDYCGTDATAPYDDIHPKSLLKTIPGYMMGQYVAQGNSNSNNHDTGKNTDTGNTDTGVSSSELATHSADNDCWLLMHGNVYDLTQYASKHPGGSSFILDYCGTDATAPYDDIHPKSLLKTVSKYLVGQYAADNSNTSNQDTGKNGNTAESDKEEEKKQEPGKEIDNSASTPVDTTVNTPVAAPVETPAPAPVGCPPSVYNMADIAAHADSSDCWMLLYSTVYDMTVYADKHPGGSRTIIRRCGVDGTNAYENFHSQGLLSRLGMSEYAVGQLGDC